MKPIKYSIVLIIAIFFCGCTVTEKIVFHENGSGQFRVGYDMGQIMKSFEESFKSDAPDSKDNSKPSKIIDTTIVFNDILESMKDSVAALPEEKRLAMEAVKDMYMNMNIDEEKEIFEFSIGLDFNNLDELKGIQDKIRKAQSLNRDADQLEAFKNDSTMSKLFGDQNQDVQYLYSESGFSRITSLPEYYKVVDSLMQDIPKSDETNEMLENAFYQVELSFPRKVKSADIDSFQLTDDGKTILYKVDWLEYIMDPRVLDINVEFEDE